MTSPIQPNDFELLSAYLDNALPASAQSDLEARLAAEPELRNTLAELRGTLRLLKAVPTVKPPRNFTLDPARYGRREPWWARYRAMQTLGTLGAFAAVILIALGIFTSTFSSAGSPAASNVVAVLPTTTVAERDERFQSTPTLAPSDKAAAPVTAGDIEPSTPSNQPVFAAPQAQPTQTSIPAASPVLPGSPTLPATVAAMLAAGTNASVAKSSAPQNGADASGGSSGSQPYATPTSIPTVTEPLAAQGMAGAAGAPAPVTPTVLARKTESQNQSAQAVGPKPPQPSGLQPLATQPSLPSALPSRGLSPTVLPRPTVLPTATVPPTSPPTTTRVPPTPTVISTAVALSASITPAIDQGNVTDSLTTVSPALSAKGTAAGRASSTQTAVQEDVRKDDRRIVQAFPVAQFLLIIGIALLVFSAMLFGIGWMRSRL